MFQSLSNPLFGVPFLLTVALGVVAAGFGVAFRAWLVRRADSVWSRRSAHAGAVGFVAGGVACVALGFWYAGSQATLLAGTPTEPTLFGRVGLVVPWGVVGVGTGVLAAVGIGAAMVFQVVDELTARDD